MSVETSPIAPPQAQHAAVPGRSWVLAAMIITIFMSALEGTIVATAMPTIISTLGGFDLFSWVFTSYLLALAISTPIYGRLADLYGRKRVLLWATGYAFAQGWLTAVTQTMLWCLVFFVASAAASSAYLTVSEIFPLEIRALAIAFFYAIGTGIGGIAGPLLFGMLISTGSRSSVAVGYVIGAILMAAAAVVQARWGVAAERKSLEAVSRPLAFID